MGKISLLPKQDAYISEWYPQDKFGSSIALFISQYQQLGDNYRSLIKFDLTEIPSSYTIEEAVLELSIYRNESQTKTNIFIYQLLEDWQEDLVTWHNSPPINMTTYSTITIEKEPFAKKVFLDLTALVNSWYRGEVPNYGLLLKGEEQINSLIAFYSRNYSNKAFQPILHISYKENNEMIEKEELFIPEYPPYAPLDASTPIPLWGKRQATFLVKNASNSCNVEALIQISYSDNPDETFFNTGNWMPLKRAGYPGEGVALTTTDTAEYARVLVKGEGGETIYVWAYVDEK